MTPGAPDIRSEAHVFVDVDVHQREADLARQADPAAARGAVDVARAVRTSNIWGHAAGVRVPNLSQPTAFDRGWPARRWTTTTCSIPPSAPGGCSGSWSRRGRPRSRARGYDRPSSQHPVRAAPAGRTFPRRDAEATQGQDP